MPGAEEAGSKGPKVRVDGTGMKREGFLFGGKSSEGSWLSESDVDFFTSGMLLFILLSARGACNLKCSFITPSCEYTEAGAQPVMHPRVQER